MLKINFDKTDNILYIEDMEFKFTMESEERLQNLHKEGILKLYGEEKELFRERFIKTILNMDRQLLNYFLLVSQDKFNKCEYEPFREHLNNLFGKNKAEIKLYGFIHEMFANYLGDLGFQIEKERGLRILKTKMMMEYAKLISALPNSIKDTAKLKQESLLKSFLN